MLFRSLLSLALFRADGAATTSSHDAATERSHKTITAGHVLEAVKQLGWEDGSELVKQLKSELIGTLLSLSLPLPLLRL